MTKPREKNREELQAEMESLVPELIAMPDEDAQTFFRLALTSEPAREFLRKRAEETTS